MDALLDRLWELANEDDDPCSARRNERIAEARALWQALEVLLASSKPQELSVGDGTFTKTLACIRSVLSDPGYWRTTAVSPSSSDTSDDGIDTVFVSVHRVLLKVGCRGEQEREALVRDGVADLIVRCGDAQPHQKEFTLSSAEVATALQTLQALALNAKNRASLQIAHTVRFCIRHMQKHETVFAVQLRGCQFLHQMTLEEDCKERIGCHGGLQVVTNALARFAEEAELVITALDVLFFLCVELEYRDASIQSVQFRSVNAATLQQVVNSVVGAMRVLQSVELVQANGVAVLNSVVMHPPVKQLLCSLDIWDIAENGLSATATDEAACDFVDLLDTLLRDPVTFETLKQTLCVSARHSQVHSVTKPRLKALKGQIEALRQSQVASKENGTRMAFVANRLQNLLDEETRDDALVIKNGLRVFANEKANDRFTNSRSYPIDPSIASIQSEDISDDELPVDSGASLGYADDARGDDKEDLLIGEDTNYFEQVLPDSRREGARGLNASHQTAPNGVDPVSTGYDHLDATKMDADTCSTCSTRAKQLDKQLDNDQKDWEVLNMCQHPAPAKSDSETSKWHALYEGSSREVERIQSALRELEERYRVVLRRSQDQTKLLALQNARIASHGNEQQQVLRRMRSLETSLNAADRRCQVERALRSAEGAQCEQLSLALNESMREAKSLAAQQSSVARELQQKETMRTEYMMRSRESKQDKHRVEIERDNALIQIEILKQEKIDILQQLAECKHEGLEALFMREEDADARRPGIFTELSKAELVHDIGQRSGSEKSHLMTRRNSLPNEVLSSHSTEIRSSVVMSSTLNRSTSVHPVSTSRSGLDVDLNDDPSTIDASEIQSCLTSVFQILDTSVEGTADGGVHVSTVRRFFMESGLIQPPTVLPADVDVILASVLAQSQTIRKNSLVRKDFGSTSQESWAPPHGWANTKKKTTSTKSAGIMNNAKRFRFFNQDAFNETVTLVSTRRFPRSDLLSALQTVMALYLRPFMRQQRTLLISATNCRSSFISSCGSSRRSSASIISPSQVCSRALKTILNGLALHLGHGNEHEYLRTCKSTGIDEGELRCHLYSPTSMNRSHKREDVVYSMLEMTGVLTREQHPLGTICEFYSLQHLSNVATAAAVSITKTELFGLSFELVLNFAMDFELIPSFMDRVSLKHLHTEVAGLLKSYFALHDKDPPSGADAETLKKVAFGMVLARLALELFCTKVNYETPEQQITGLLQWIDNSPGREKIMRKAGMPLVIRFSRQLYAVKAQN